MDRMRMAGLVFGTAAVALGIGFVMQTFAQSGDHAMAPAPVRPVAAAGFMPLPGRNVVTRNETDLMGEPQLTELRVSEAPETACVVTATAAPAPRASVQLEVSAPCYPDATITVHHTGLMFTSRSDAEGALSITVPALRENAVFMVSLGDGQGAVTMVQVPELAHWTRMVLQWEGETDLQIHAREFGANYGATGHVWTEVPENPVTGSYMTRLGDGSGLMPRSAEVYSFPRAQGLSGTVALTVETEVTPANCGHDISAEVLDLRGVDRLSSRQLDLTMPNCGAVGDFLVLNNLMEDLKIAAK